MRGNDDNLTGQSVALYGFCGLAVFGVICLIWALGGLNGKQAEQRETQSHRHAAAAKAYAERSCAKVNRADVFECIYDNVEASEETARAEQELTAQQTAAWAGAMGAIISFVTLLVSAIGLWFIRGTLDQSRFAVRATEESSERQLRAYLGAASINYVAIENQPKVVVEVKNSGQTPAMICHIKIRSMWINEEKARTSLGLIDVDTEALVSAGASVNLPFTMKEGSSEIMENAEGSLLVMFSLNYVDAFNRKREFTSMFLSGNDFDPDESCALGANMRGHRGT